jgi:hypothetical protein|tara:strand:- start:55993 stop:56178 length:186 start_codon:yes stop_codon:yes gene_type:complete
LKIFITKIDDIDGKEYVGPQIIAKDREDADREAEERGIMIVGVLETVITEEVVEGWNKVLH